MKKNFLAIASLLIAAMLLMVSCNQEVAPVDNGRVKASLLIDDSRKLVVSDDIGEVTYKYRLDHKWADLSIKDVSQGVYGETPAETWLDLPQDNSLGYVTQGLWTVSVRGYKGNNVVLEGSVNHYFNTQSTVVMVPVVPSEGTGKVNLTIQMNDLEAGVSDAVYKLSYSLVALDGHPVDVSKNAFVKDEGKDGANGTYKVSNLSLAAGYYLLTVNVTETKDGDVKNIGGSTITFLVINEGTVGITGYVEPNTFDNDTVKIDIIAAKPVLTLTNASNLTIGSDVAFGLSDEASETYTGYNYTVEYVVYVDGVIKTLNEDYTISDTDTKLTVKKETFGSNPGPKTVTLVKKVTVTPFGQAATTIMGSCQIDVTLEPATN